eukprot:Hpha_TRINITY_DN17020_c2_g3::TRINITY_DN17020_c2_g3_i10::g.165945::m.165945
MAAGSPVKAVREKAGQVPAVELAKDFKACCLEAEAVVKSALLGGTGTEEERVRLVVKMHAGLNEAVKDLKKFLPPVLVDGHQFSDDAEAQAKGELMKEDQKRHSREGVEEQMSEEARIESDLKKWLHAPVPLSMSKEEHHKQRRHKLNALCATPHCVRLLTEFAARFDNFLELMHERRPKIKRGKTGGPEQSGGRDAAPAKRKAARAEDFAELMRLPPRERKVCVIDSNESLQPLKLIDWVDSLPKLERSLGYEVRDIGRLTTDIEFAVEREKKNLTKMLEKAEGAAELEVADWMVSLALEGAERGFELFLAGVLYTAELDAATSDQEHLEAHGMFGATEQQLDLFRVMNAAMRNVTRCMRPEETDVFKCKPEPPQLHVLRTFRPLIQRTQELVEVLPSQETIVFRGITVNVSAKYRVGSRVMWNAFSSTSLSREEAEGFMSKRDGTFFLILAKRCAVSVEGCSAMGSKERELLYKANVEFQVMAKFSPTLLRMLGFAFDIIIMQEVVDGKADADPRTCAEVIKHITEFFKSFLAQYVEGRLGDKPTVPETESKRLDDWCKSWLEKPRSSRPPVCIVGDGGTGKTSAAVALMCRMAQKEEGEEEMLSATPADDSCDGNVEQEMDVVSVGGSRAKVLPVFISLPAFGIFQQSKEEEEGDCLKKYIGRVVGLEEEGLEQLVQNYDVVVLLDSLDETGDAFTGGVSLDEAGVAFTRGERFLERYSWVKDKCSVVLTVRGEWLKMHSHVCRGLELKYLQQFRKVDSRAYVARRLGEDAEIQRGLREMRAQGSGDTPVGALDWTTEVEAERLFTEFEWAMKNPFLLSMLMQDPAGAVKCAVQKKKDTRAMEDADLYELYLRQYAKKE